MKIGDQVVVMECIDQGVTLEEYLGRAGTVVWAPPQNGPRAGEQVAVQFANGTEDAFWPWELEVVDE
jgi:hypothetical protein